MIKNRRVTWIKAPTPESAHKDTHAIERRDAATMSGKADDYSTEEIASELKRIADIVRQGPLEPAALTQAIARVETIAKFILGLPEIDPVIAERLEQLAQQLRNRPSKKNGATT